MILRIKGDENTNQDKIFYKKNLGLGGERVGCGWSMDLWWSMQGMTKTNLSASVGG
jgi:hypothetical protein